MKITDVQYTFLNRHDDNISVSCYNSGHPRNLKVELKEKYSITGFVIQHSSGWVTFRGLRV